MTICEIASRFNVSAVTVSKALNYRKGVSNSLGEKIRKYAKTVGYTPNFAARTLASGNSNIIGVCMRSRAVDFWYSEILTQFQERMTELGYCVNTMFIESTNNVLDTTDRELSVLNFFRPVNTRAVLLGPCDPPHIAKIKKKIGSLDGIIGFDASDQLEIPHLRLNGPQAVELALEYFFRRGHRKIGIAGFRTWERKNIVYGGWLAAFINFIKSHNLEIHEEWMLENPEKMPGGELYEKIRRMFALPSHPTALFCHNDVIAMIAARAARDCGLRVPEDISLIGVDDHPLDIYSSPAITTLKFNLESYIDNLVRITLAVIKGEAGPELSYVSNAELIERESVMDCI